MEMTTRTTPDVWLIRHGENRMDRVSSAHWFNESPAHPGGRGTSEKRFRRRLQGVSFARVFYSPLQRAGAPPAKLAGYDSVAEVDKNLVEWDYGDYEGKMATGDSCGSAPIG